MTGRRSNLLTTTVVALWATALPAQRGAFTESVTDRGMRIWSFPDDGGERFVLAVVVGVGARDEGPQQHGIAHFLEHVVLARTQLRPKAAADPDLQALGVAWNGVTSHESTVYYLQCDPSDWHFAVDWLADHVLHPAIDPEDVEAERRIVRAELAARSAHVGEVTFESLLYPGHALGRSIGGTPAELEAIDRASLEQFHALHYCAANVAVGFAGRVPRDECSEAIRQAFAGLRSGRVTPAGAAVRPRAGEFSARAARGDQPASMIVGYHLPAASARDLALAKLVGAYLESRFFTEVREQRQLAYAPRVDVLPRRDTCRLDLSVDNVPERGDLATVRSIVATLIGELQQVDVARLATARASLAGLLEASNGAQLASAMELGWLLRRHGISPSELGLALNSLGEREVAEFARTHLVERNRFVVADVPLARPFSAGAVVAAVAVLLLLLDSFGSFARTRALGALLARWLRLPRRTDQASAPAAQPAEPRPSRPIVPVPGDELEKSIQRYFEEEERGR